MAAFLREALRVPMLCAACVNMAQQFIKTHIVCLHLYKREFESTPSVHTEGLSDIPLGSLAEILMVFSSRFCCTSAFLTLNIHCPVEYDQGSAKEDHFVT